MFSSESVNNVPSLGIFLAYGLLILLYLVILRLLLNLIQQMGDKHSVGKSVIDRDIHLVMTERVDSSMQTFDAFGIALVIAKGAIAALAIAAIFFILVIKFGLLAAVILVFMAIMLLWAFNRWLKSREKPGSWRTQVRKYVQSAGSVGTIIMLSIGLAVLLFAMILIH